MRGVPHSFAKRRGGGRKLTIATIDMYPAPNVVVAPGAQFAMYAYADNFVDLAGYEVGVDASGGTSGTLTVEDIYIDDQRPDYVFSGLSPYNAFDVAGARFMSALDEGGVDSSVEVYLGTFVFRASQDASGAFTVSLRPDEGTIAVDSLSDEITVQITSDATVRVRSWGFGS